MFLLLVIACCKSSTQVHIYRLIASGRFASRAAHDKDATKFKDRHNVCALQLPSRSWPQASPQLMRTGSDAVVSEQPQPTAFSEIRNKAHQCTYTAPQSRPARCCKPVTLLTETGIAVVKRRRDLRPQAFATSRCSCSNSARNSVISPVAARPAGRCRVASTPPPPQTVTRPHARLVALDLMDRSSWFAS